MPKSFSITFTGSAASLLESARQAAEANGAQFTGDTISGAFSGQGVEGRYNVTGNTVTLTIDKKPMIAPWSIVESQIRQFFSS